jgi:hypothetical protein
MRHLKGHEHQNSSSWFLPVSTPALTLDEAKKKGIGLAASVTGAGTILIKTVKGNRSVGSHCVLQKIQPQNCSPREDWRLGAKTKLNGKCEALTLNLAMGGCCGCGVQPTPCFHLRFVCLLLNHG